MTYRSPALPEPDPPPDPGARAALTRARVRWWGVHLGPIAVILAGAALLYGGAWIGIPLMGVAAVGMRIMRGTGVLDAADQALTLAKARAGLADGTEPSPPPSPRAFWPWAIAAGLAFAMAPASCALGWNDDANVALWLYAVTGALALALVLGIVARRTWFRGNGVRRIYEQAAELEDKLLGSTAAPRVRIAPGAAPVAEAPEPAAREEDEPAVSAASTRSGTP